VLCPHYAPLGREDKAVGVQPLPEHSLEGLVGFAGLFAPLGGLLVHL
jgi:hypothetical protein